MQNVLCIDISQEPAEAAIVSVNDNKLELQETHTLMLGEELSLETLKKNAESPHFNIVVAEESTNEQENNVEEDNLEQPEEKESPLLSLCQKFSSSWNQVILIIPSIDHMSFPMEMPFDDEKNIEKIIDLEVQDIVPFDVSEFLVQFKIIQETPKGENTYVNLIPKSLIRYILTKCKLAGIEPKTLTTPAGALNAPFFLAPNYFDHNSAIVFANQSECYLTFFLNESTCHEQTIQIHEDMSRNDLLQKIKLSINSIEKKYSETIENLYIFEDSLPTSELQSATGRKTLSIKSEELVEKSTEEAKLSQVASLFAQEYGAPQLLTDFRAREFTYSAYLRIILNAIKKLLPYTIALLVIGSLYAASTYLGREVQIRRNKAAIVDAISEHIPGISIDQKSPLNSLANQNAIIEKELEALGSSSSSSILDTLKQIAGDIKQGQNNGTVTIKSIEIKNDRIFITGSAGSYAEVSKLDSIFKKAEQSGKYCGVTNDTPRGGGGSRQFKFKIMLC